MSIVRRLKRPAQAAENQVTGSHELEPRALAQELGSPCGTLCPLVRAFRGLADVHILGQLNDAAPLQHSGRPRLTWLR
jgi:hypothetical protein